MSQSSVPLSGQPNSVTRECDCLAHQFGNAADNPMCERRYATGAIRYRSVASFAFSLVGYLWPMVAAVLTAVPAPEPS
ncbi:hypothetical protein OHA61_21845 [Streptomyces sp. NBC_00885]|uniref:hypothetical protein n=1 Tax=Streptomyces sp. NBC_00885 TaxID=2975857 RepID=UPI0038633F20|nr:hypothetical protein OHA61_21845 [Streptomyces sp. NBC_00885]